MPKSRGRKAVIGPRPRRRLASHVRTSLSLTSHSSLSLSVSPLLLLVLFPAFVYILCSLFRLPLPPLGVANISPIFFLLPVQLERNCVSLSPGVVGNCSPLVLKPLLSAYFVYAIGWVIVQGVIIVSFTFELRYISGLNFDDITFYPLTLCYVISSFV